MASKRQDEISFDRVEAELGGEEGELMATERVFSDQWGDWKRSCYCGEPRAAAVGQEMTSGRLGAQPARPRRGYLCRSARSQRHLSNRFSTGSRPGRVMRRPSRFAPKM